MLNEAISSIVREKLQMTELIVISIPKSHHSSSSSSRRSSSRILCASDCVVCNVVWKKALGSNGCGWCALRRAAPTGGSVAVTLHDGSIFETLKF